MNLVEDEILFQIFVFYEKNFYMRSCSLPNVEESITGWPLGHMIFFFFKYIGVFNKSIAVVYIYFWSIWNMKLFFKLRKLIGYPGSNFNPELIIYYPDNGLRSEL